MPKPKPSGILALGNSCATLGGAASSALRWAAAAVSYLRCSAWQEQVPRPPVRSYCQGTPGRAAAAQRPRHPVPAPYKEPACAGILDRNLSADKGALASLGRDARVR